MEPELILEFIWKNKHGRIAEKMLQRKSYAYWVLALVDTEPSAQTTEENRRRGAGTDSQGGRAGSPVAQGILAWDTEVSQFHTASMSFQIKQFRDK